MSDLSSIITELEQQRATIDRALSALRDVSGTSEPRRPGRPKKAASADSAPATEAPKKKRILSPTGRKRIIAALKKRWPETKAAAGASPRRPSKKISSKMGTA